MYRIKTLNKISAAGLNLLDQTRFQVGGDVENEDGILVRSAAMHDYVFPDALRAIARAGAGTNNIPIDRCSENGIVVFNTPGANANAVKELVIAALLLASRDIVGGCNWVREQVADDSVKVEDVVEKGKAAFAGPELYHKTLGVIGLGAIGALVCNVALELGMDVYGYDPFLSVGAALRLDRHVHVVQDVEELYRVSDYITIHVPYTNDTKDFINADTIAKMKGHVRILNLARAVWSTTTTCWRHWNRAGWPGTSPISPMKRSAGGRMSLPCPIWARPRRRARRTAPGWPLIS